MDEQKIQQRRREHDEQSTQQRSAILGLPYLDTRPFEADIALVKDVLTLQEMYSGHVVPLKEGSEDHAFQFGATTQTPQSLINAMRQKYEEKGFIAQFNLISNSAYKAFMNRHDPPKQVSYDDIKIATEGDSDTIAQVSQTLNSVAVDKVFNYLISQADKLNASDIHIENQREDIRIRLRVDGVLHPVAKLNKDRYRIILGELSSRANISTAAKEPQSGHMQSEITTEQGTHLLNIRVESIPTMYGLDAVLRLFNFDETLLSLDSLGIPESQRREIDEIVSHPRGLVLMVGPTGSGKSTTLYSMLNALNSTDKKIITLEDPIEYGLNGISQVTIDTTNGQDFASGLRSVLRLDPDVVMVGEIRDKDTARTAIQASITGHLVLSTFHANSTAAAFSRMIDLIGVNPIFSNAIRLVIAQRLVRRLVDETKEAYRPDEATIAHIKDVLKDLPDSVEKPDLDNITLYKPVASESAPFGFSGRLVIMEQMTVTEDVQKFIRGDVSDIVVEDIERAAKHSGMVTLEQAGILAVLRGETTLEEIAKVI